MLLSAEPSLSLELIINQGLSAGKAGMYQPPCQLCNYLPALSLLLSSEMWPRLAWYPLCIPGWSQTHSNPPVSATQRSVIVSLQHLAQCYCCSSYRGNAYLHSFFGECGLGLCLNLGLPPCSRRHCWSSQQQSEL